MSGVFHLDIHSESFLHSSWQTCTFVGEMSVGGTTVDRMAWNHCWVIKLCSQIKWIFKMLQRGKNSGMIFSKHLKVILKVVSSFGVGWHHRHVRKFDWLMGHTACLVCLVSTVSGRSKKERKQAKFAALVAGTQQNLSNLFL